MKSFLDHLKEEVLPSVQVADGGLDISKPAVRAAINAAIAGVVSQPAVTPYVVFNRLSKLLAQYHIVIPKRFLEGDKGVEVFEVKQFGHKMGMTDSGEFVNEVPATHYLFLQYGILSPFGITYAKPIVGGMFKVMARLVDKAELDKLMDMAEITMAEEAEQMQAIAKANAPKEGMHTALGDCDCSQGDSPSTKKAIKVSMKKIDEEYEKVEAGVKKRRGETHTLHRRNPGHKTEYHTITTERDGRKSVKTGSPKYIKKHWDRMEEDTLDEASTEKLVSYRNKAGEGREKGAKLAYAKLTGKAKVKASAPKSAYMEEDKDPCWKGYEMIGMKKKGGKPVPNCVPVKEATDKDRDLSKLASAAMSKGQAVKKLPAGRAQNAVLPKGMAKGANIEKGRWSGHGSFNEEQIDELKKSTLGSYIKKASHDVATRSAETRGGAMKSAAALEKQDYTGFRKHGQHSNKMFAKSWKRREGIAKAADKLAKEETIAEKAPPGAKFERMVKHIKKGYAKDGELTAKEKGIAFATAWKAKNREKGE